MLDGGGALGKKVNALVQEQLQYCRSLRRADLRLHLAFQVKFSSHERSRLCLV